MAVPKDQNRIALQVFSPDGTMDVPAGDVDVMGVGVVTFADDVNYKVKDTEPAMPLQAGMPLGVGHLVSINIDVATTMAYMRG